MINKQRDHNLIKMPKITLGAVTAYWKIEFQARPALNLQKKCEPGRGLSLMTEIQPETGPCTNPAFNSLNLRKILIVL